MSNIQPYQGSNELPVSRRASRALNGLGDQTLIKLARVQQVAVVQSAKTDTVAYVGMSAMQHVALISETEGRLAQLVPLATTRLEATANTVALALAEVVIDTATRMRSL